jgi:crotonobetainyl-CoA:carnitine CoA-transferase CaiB-like acyl-CoA transferase
VLDFSTQIAGPYCSKLFADAGAEVVKVEPPGGDPMRKWSASGAPDGDEASALYSFLNAGKRSLVGRSSDPAVAERLATADLVIEAHGLAGDAGEPLDVGLLRAVNPAAVVLSITPYGLGGPWTGRPATEFTLQAEAGSLGVRGLPGGEPFQAGGRITEWAAGAYGGAASLAAVLRARRGGPGEHIDLSLLETANTIFTNFAVTMNRLLNGDPGPPERSFFAPSVETPSVEPTADGYVGFCTNARQQFADFLSMIGRPDLLEDEGLVQPVGRTLRFAEWNGIVHEWCAGRTSAEIIEMASLYRIPVAPVGNGRTVIDHEQHVARRVYVPDPGGRFLQPRRPYLIDGRHPAGPAAPPTDTPPADSNERGGSLWTGQAEDAGRLPLEGLRIVDLTAWWAGPAASHLLACLGAEVIHIESADRPDAMRMVGAMMAGSFPDWWEASPHFLHANSNKRGVTLDLNDGRGRDLLDRLVSWCDVLIENYTPRVLENFGLTWERFQELNPQALLVRMPAFGLDGPWRDRPGFAQTVEQLSGLAWVTGHRSDQPRIPRGPCDPIAGMHAAFAVLATVVLRARTGRGHHVECTLAETALNIAAEQVLEWTAYGRLLERDGNRSAQFAPQGLYPCVGDGTPTGSWLALSVSSDEQWRALRSALGDPAWAADPALDSLDGRRSAHDRIDTHLAEWTRTRGRDEAVSLLRSHGVVASAVFDPSRLLETVPPFASRGYCEAPAHPVVGPMPLPSLPFRFAGVDKWLRRPAPTLGEHNAAVLAGILGLSGEELSALEDAGIIGSRPRGIERA